MKKQKKQALLTTNGQPIDAGMSNDMPSFPKTEQNSENNKSVDFWKEKVSALEQSANEKTADLLEKNRELEIEAALERVRSRTMTMQKSNELKEVIQTVYEQFVGLGIKIEHTGFVIDYKARDDYDIWIADPLGVPSEVTIPYFDSVYYNRFNEAKEKGEHFFATNLSFEEKNKFYQKLFEYVPGLPEDAKKFYFSCPGLAASTVLLDNVSLYIENFTGTPYSDEENSILMRFGKVFQQTYTRFLDLQNAEAQTRGAQIELGLERVRARAMAMDTSAELKEVVKILFEELRHLDVNLQACLIATFDPVTFDQRSWIIHSKTNEPYCFLIPCNKQPFYEEMLKAWKEKNANWSYMLEGEAKTKWENFLFTYTDFKLLPTEVKEEIGKHKKVFFAASYYQYGAIQA